MDRRTFIATSSAATLAGMLALPRRAAADNGRKVLVIGAGIAGLSAGRALHALGFAVTLLEGAGHTGGRLLTDQSLGAPFEVGAGWIHGPAGNPISQLAKNVGAGTFVTDDESFAVFTADGAAVADDEITTKAARLEAIYRKVDDRLDADQPLARAIARVASDAADDPVLAWMQSAYTEFDTGGPLDRLSALHFDEDDAFDGADVILPGGYDAILAPLAAGLDIRLEHRVSRIEHGEDGAAVHADGEMFEADYVICTCPLGVLQKASVTFDPPLPSVARKSIDRIGMGNVTKIALKFADAHWPVDTQYFGLMTKERGRWNYWLNYRTFCDENILLGLSVGNYAARIEAEPDAVMVADAMDAVRTMFGGAVPDPTDHRITRWSQNPLSMGAYSYARVGAVPEDFDSLAEPMSSSLVLAGEHTTFDYHATVHGAYLSGLNAAVIVSDA